MIQPCAHLHVLNTYMRGGRMRTLIVVLRLHLQLKVRLHVRLQLHFYLRVRMYLHMQCAPARTRGVACTAA